MVWVEFVTTSKLLDSPHSHINKKKSVLKACRADMPYNTGGDIHIVISDSSYPCSCTLNH